MRSRSEWKKGAVPKRQFRRRVLFVACLSLCGFVGRAIASELVIGREVLQTLDDQGQAAPIELTPDMLLIARLKRKKLKLKDEITGLEDQLNPDIIA